MPGFTPPGMIQTAAQQRAAGRGGARTRRPRRARPARAKARAGTKRTKRAGKPRPGTKAWMAYIRGKRGKKRK